MSRIYSGPTISASSPNFPCYSRFHCWSAAQRVVQLAKIVVQRVERQRMNVVFDLLREAQRQVGEAPDSDANANRPYLIRSAILAISQCKKGALGAGRLGAGMGEWRLPILPD